MYSKSVVVVSSCALPIDTALSLLPPTGRGKAEVGAGQGVARDGRDIVCWTSGLQPGQEAPLLVIWHRLRGSGSFCVVRGPCVPWLHRHLEMRCVTVGLALRACKYLVGVTTCGEPTPHSHYAMSFHYMQRWQSSH